MLLHWHNSPERPSGCVSQGLYFRPGKLSAYTSGHPIYYSDITARFVSDKDIHRLSFVASDLTYFFPDGLPAITDVSFSATEGRLIGIMEPAAQARPPCLIFSAG